MSEPYLVLHKVRGEPAFDIAERWTFDDEEGWIVSTSGHRAYPWAHWKVDDLAWVKDISDRTPFSYPTKTFEDKKQYGFPSDWPDHYSCNDRPSRSSPSFTSRAKGLLESLGLVKAKLVDRRD